MKVYFVLMAIAYFGPYLILCVSLWIAGMWKTSAFFAFLAAVMIPLFKAAGNWIWR